MQCVLLVKSNPKERLVKEKETMAEYVALEKEIYDSIRGRPFTSIPTKPTWAQKELLNEEAEQIALDVNVSYPWSEDYGYLQRYKEGTNT